MDRKFNFEATQKAVKDLLIAVGEDPERPGLKETPKRVAGYWQELLEGNKYTNQEIADMYSKKFDVGYDPLVTEWIDDCYSHCFSYNTRVLTPDGNNKMISKFKVGDLIKTFNQETGEMENRKVTFIHKHKTNQWRKLGIGNTITTVTDDHPYFNKDMELIKAKDLKPGDKVWGLRQHYINNKNRIDIKSFNRDYNLGYILGVLLSDGCIWRNTLKLQVTEEWFADRFASCIEKCFGLTPTKSIYHSHGFKDDVITYQIRITNSQICSILSELCNEKYGTKEFSIPRIIFDDYEIFKGFFEAYLDGDGSEYTGKTNTEKSNKIMSSNKDFILEVANIFQRSWYEDIKENGSIFNTSLPLCFNNRDTKKGYEIKLKERFNNLKNTTPTTIYKDMKLETVVFNEKMKNFTRDAYNLEIEGNHTYIANSIYVHNCEHHLALMFDGHCIIGYIPVRNEDGTYKVLGLSKLNRITDMCCRRLQLQEKIASDIAECISLATGSKSVYVNLTMKHGCVSARGAKSRAFTNVTFMTEELRRNHEARQEFQQKAVELTMLHKGN